jgi:hypothetical protein
MMHTQSTAALTRALRPPRAGTADSDTRVMRDALSQILAMHLARPESLRKAGYSSKEDFELELKDLLSLSCKQFTPIVLSALYGKPDATGRARDGRLGRLLGLV